MRLLCLLLIVMLAFSISGCTRKIEAKPSENSDTGPSGSGGVSSGPQAIIESHGEYELMLPADYSPSKSYPLLFCLHPSGNGKGYVNYLKPLSKDSGWIIAASNKFRNGIPPIDFLPSVESSIAEIGENHKVTKVYLCGFSGGGMGSYMSTYLKPGAYAGVISNDGTIHPAMRNAVELRKMLLGKSVIMSGEGDTIEPPSVLQEDKRLLEEAGVNTYFISFSGGHQLAPIDKYREALDWLEGD